MLNRFNQLQHVADPEIHMLLTSAGVTTLQMKDQLSEMVASRGTPMILVATDAVRPMHRTNDGVSRAQAFTHKAESAFATWWTNKWLEYAFGEKAEIIRLRLGALSSREFQEATDASDALILAEGNTYLLADGVTQHSQNLRHSKLVTVTASAGSIVAGCGLWPASLKPKDTEPQYHASLRGIGAVNADIVVHAEDPELDRPFDIPGISGEIGRRTLQLLAQTSQSTIISTYLETSPPRGIPTVYLHDTVAAEVSGGHLSFIQ